MDVLNAEQELLDARVQLISTTVDEHLSVYRLLFQMGRLTVEYLNLPVQKYDVEKYYELVKASPASKSRNGRKLDELLQQLNKD